MEQTPKYGLKKPGESDYGDVIVMNENADKMDAAMDGLEKGKEALVKNAAEKSTPVDADGLVLVDSADNNKTKRLLWSWVKAVLKAWFDSIYAARTHGTTHKTGGADALTPGDIGAEIAGAAATVQTNLNTHVGDATKHITSAERATWNGKAAGSHTHGNLTNDGKIGTTADMPIFTGTGGALATKTAAAARTALGVPSIADTAALLALPPWVRIATYETAGAFTWTAPDLFNGADYEIGVWECGGGGTGGAISHASTSDSYYYNIATGGASGRARAFKMTVTPGTTYSLVVGAGGAKITFTTTWSNGNNGGSTSFNGIAVDGGEGGKYGYTSTGTSSVSAAIGAQCSTGLSVPLNTNAFNSFLLTLSPFGGVLMPHSLYVSSGSPIYDFSNLGMVGFPNECFDPFACVQRLAAGGGAYFSSKNTVSSLLPPGLNPIDGLGGGVASTTDGTPAGSATAPGCGGGAFALHKTGTHASTSNGAGAPGAVYIYARRAAA